jgi:hypothetical protein
LKITAEQNNAAGIEPHIETEVETCPLELFDWLGLRFLSPRP